MSSILDSREDIIREGELTFPIDDNWLWDIGFKQVFYPSGIRPNRYFYNNGNISIRLSLISIENNVWDCSTMYDRFYVQTRKELLAALGKMGLKMENYD